MKIKLLLFTFLMSTLVLQAHPGGHHSHSHNHHDDPYYGYDSKIQIALVLDVSGSMEGLLDQAKSQLWHIVNGLTSEYDYGYMPQLELALFELGNNRLGYRSGYMRQVVPFTQDLDWISEEMFYLHTGGHREYYGQAIELAVNSLRWSNHPEDLKMIFIAGNESFDQGGIDFQRAIRKATSRDISVNTIYCGRHHKGVQYGWLSAAKYGGGEYMNIDHNSYIRYEPVPMDDRLTYLNGRFNDTYIPYGTNGVRYKSRQLEQDRNAGKYGVSYQSQRTIAKASGTYRNHEWDLIDAIDEGKVNLATIPNHQLPVEMRSMTMAQKRAYIAKKRALRQEVKMEIRTLAKKRKAVKAEPRNTPKQSTGTSAGNKPVQPRVKSLDNAILESSKKQREKKSQEIRKRKVETMNKSNRPASTNKSQVGSSSTRNPKTMPQREEIGVKKAEKPVEKKSTEEVTKNPRSSSSSAMEMYKKRMNGTRTPIRRR